MSCRITTTRKITTTDHTHIDLDLVVENLADLQILLIVTITTATKMMQFSLNWKKFFYFKSSKTLKYENLIDEIQFGTN